MIAALIADVKQYLLVCCL